MTNAIRTPVLFSYCSLGGAMDALGMMTGVLVRARPCMHYAIMETVPVVNTNMGIMIQTRFGTLDKQ